MSCELLRTRLNEIANNGKPEIHSCLIDKLSSEIAHSIKVLTEPESNLNFNCVMYAFRIEDIPQRIQLPTDDSDYFYADTHFIQILIDRKYIIEEQEPANDYVIVYFDKCEKIKHIGRLISESRVISKWGIGHLYEHDFFETPSDYGNTIRFFKPPSHEIVIQLFRKYACGQGFRFFKKE